MECINLIKNKMDFICKNTFNFKNDSFKSITIILTKNNFQKKFCKGFFNFNLFQTSIYNVY